MFPVLRRPGALARPGARRRSRPRRASPRGRPSPIVGSHDTASAVVAVPAGGPRFAYIACGTWSLVGVELEAPVLTEASRAANFTNEAGVDGRVRYLRNVMGLWILQETMRTWERDGTPEELGRLLQLAAALPAGGPVVDPDEPVFLPPGDMPSRIEDACLRGGLRPPSTRAAVVRCILDSLAAAYARAVDDATRLSGVDVVDRAPRRRRGAERAPLPAHRRRLRPAGHRRARSRRPRSATCSSRRARGGSSPATSRRCARSSGRPTTCGGSSPRRGDAARSRAERDARRPVHHLLQRPAVPGRRAGDGPAPPASRARGRLPRGADVLRPDALQHRLPRRLRAARPPLRGRVRRLRRRGHALGVVRGDGPSQPRDGRRGVRRSRARREPWPRSRRASAS